MKDLHILPKVRDSWSYLYIEHAHIDQEDKGICVHDARGRVHVPCASLHLLLLGPGTTVTHAAIATIAASGCVVGWTGEQQVRFYATGLGETRSSSRLLRQASLWADPAQRLRVVRRMYEMRFPDGLPAELTLRQIRGKEGARVRAAYAEASRRFGVPWGGRDYDRDSWDAADPLNRALSAANSTLYGVCHAAIVAAGYSPGLGFVHTGKMLSFVYDVADLYKVEITVPAAFMGVAEGEARLEARVRHRCRDLFVERELLGRILADLDRLLGPAQDSPTPESVDADPAQPGDLWDPAGAVEGGRNFEGV